MHFSKGWLVAAAMATCGSLFLSLPAAADWRDTRWGMTPSEATAALGAAAQPNRDHALDAAGFRATLTAPYNADGVSFTAVFLFDPENRLQVVTLEPIGEVCPAVARALDANHGAPEGMADMGQARTLRWDDAENDNLIVYADFGGDDCTVQYSKLPPTQPDGKGL